jgi:alanine racemase
MTHEPVHTARLQYLQQDSSALTWAEVNLDRIEENYRAIRRHVPAGTAVMPVIKANGYGHGALPVARVLLPHDPPWFGVATIEEGSALRQAGITTPILVLSRLVPWNAALALRRRLTPVIFNKELALAFNDAARERRRKVRVHLKVDTGMGRLGVLPRDFGAFCDLIDRLGNLEVEGIMTNFATADDTTDPYFEEQLKRFTEMSAEARRRFPTLRYVHCANSATIQRAMPRAAFDMVRPGLMLYGVSPLEAEDIPVRVRPALQLKTRIIHLQKQEKGAGISYGKTFVTSAPRLIATLPVGYRDGFNRLLSNRSEVLIRGQRVPQVGNVCMDLAMVDVTDVPGVSLYDEVILIGRKEGEELHVTELADWIGTIPYEVFCTIGSRVERRYVSSRFHVPDESATEEG